MDDVRPLAPIEADDLHERRELVIAAPVEQRFRARIAANVFEQRTVNDPVVQRVGLTSFFPGGPSDYETLFTLPGHPIVAVADLILQPGGKVVITVEPEPDDAQSGYPVRPLVDMFVEDLGQGVSQALTAGNPAVLAGSAVSAPLPPRLPPKPCPQLLRAVHADGRRARQGAPLAGGRPRLRWARALPPRSKSSRAASTRPAV